MNTLLAPSPRYDAQKINVQMRMPKATPEIKRSLAQCGMAARRHHTVTQFVGQRKYALARSTEGRVENRSGRHVHHQHSAVVGLLPLPGADRDHQLTIGQLGLDVVAAAGHEAGDQVPRRSRRARCRSVRRPRLPTSTGKRTTVPATTAPGERRAGAALDERDRIGRDSGIGPLQHVQEASLGGPPGASTRSRNCIGSPGRQLAGFLQGLGRLRADLRVGGQEAW